MNNERIDVLAEDDDGMPIGYADWYNRQFAGQCVNTARDHHCETAWRAGALHTSAAVAELIEAAGLTISYVNGTFYVDLADGKTAFSGIPHGTHLGAELEIQQARKAALARVGLKRADG